MNLELMMWFVIIFLFGMVIGVVIGMIRMWFYMHKKYDPNKLDKGSLGCMGDE